MYACIKVKLWCAYFMIYFYLIVSHFLTPGKLMKFIDNAWKEISERERLQLSKTEGQVSFSFHSQDLIYWLNLLSIGQTIIMMLVLEIWYWMKTDNLLIYIFLYANHLSALYIVLLIIFILVLVSVWNQFVSNRVIMH